MTAARDLNRAMARTARQQAARAIAGTDGGAATARPSRTLETIRAGVTAMEMQDTALRSSLSLTGRQADAATKLQELWQACLPGLALPGGYGSMGAGHGGERHLTDDEWQATETAWRQWKEAMDYLLRNAGQAHYNAVGAAVIRGERAYAPAVRDGLDWLARFWRMK